MPTPITVSVNFIDLTGSAINGYMTANLISPTGINNLYVAGTGIIAPKLSTSSTSTNVSVSIWGNDVVVDAADGATDTYYTVNLYNTSNTLIWSAAYAFTGAGPINLVGFPSLVTVPVPSFPFAARASGVNGSVQFASGGYFASDIGLLYSTSTESLYSQTNASTFVVTVSNVGTPGAGSYSYTVVAKRGSIEIAIGTGSTATGNATLSGANYNSLSWPSIGGATSYDVYVVYNVSPTLLLRNGFLATTSSLAYNDQGTMGTIGISNGGPTSPEDGFIAITNGLLVYNSNPNTVQSHFGDSSGKLNLGGYFSTLVTSGPPDGRNEFITAASSRSTSSPFSTVSIASSDSSYNTLQVFNFVNNTFNGYGACAGSFISLANKITDAANGPVGVLVEGIAQDCNLTGFAQDYDHGTVLGGFLTAQFLSTTTNSHADAVVGSFSQAVASTSGGFTGTVTYLVGAAGALQVGNDGGATVPSITNGYDFKSGPIDNLNGVAATFTNKYGFFADNPSIGSPQIVITNAYGFYAKSQVPAHGVGTITSAFYAEDQGNAAGSWALFTAGTTPSKFGGSVTAASSILTAATPTVAAAQIGLGTSTATSATAGANGAVPAQVVGYMIVNIAGTNYKVPYFNN